MFKYKTFLYFFGLTAQLYFTSECQNLLTIYPHKVYLIHFILKVVI